MRIVSQISNAGSDATHHIDGPGLCDLLSMSPAMLSELKKRGIAVHHGRDAWDLEETVRNYVTHLRGIASGRGDEESALNLTAERARLAKEQADAQSLKNAALRETLVDAGEVERKWADVLRQVRSRIMAVPSRLRQARGLAVSDVAAMDAELRAALAELGSGDG